MSTHRQHKRVLHVVEHGHDASHLLWRSERDAIMERVSDAWCWHTSLSERVSSNNSFITFAQDRPTSTPPTAAVQRHGEAWPAAARCVYHTRGRSWEVPSAQTAVQGAHSRPWRAQGSKSCEQKKSGFHPSAEHNDAHVHGVHTQPFGGKPTGSRTPLARENQDGRHSQACTAGIGQRRKRYACWCQGGQDIDLPQNSNATSGSSTSRHWQQNVVESTAALAR
jgi:hypothetical protein